MLFDLGNKGSRRRRVTELPFRFTLLWFFFVLSSPRPSLRKPSTFAALRPGWTVPCLFIVAEERETINQLNERALILSVLKSSFLCLFPGSVLPHSVRSSVPLLSLGYVRRLFDFLAVNRIFRAFSLCRARKHARAFSSVTLGWFKYTQSSRQSPSSGSGAVILLSFFRCWKLEAFA